MGRNFDGESIWTDLKDTRIAWDFLRKAWAEVLGWFENSCETLILVAHIKDSSIVKGDEVIEAIDMKVQGQQKSILAGKASAIGMLYRDPKDNNKNILSFKVTERNVVAGARLKHLANEDFMISEYNPETKEVTTHWDKIFI